MQAIPEWIMSNLNEVCWGYRIVSMVCWVIQIGLVVPAGIKSIDGERYNYCDYVNIIGRRWPVYSPQNAFTSISDKVNVYGWSILPTFIS